MTLQMVRMVALLWGALAIVILVYLTVAMA